MSTAVATQTPRGLAAWVQADDVRTRIADAVKDVMPPETFIAHMLTAFQGPDVRACTDASKFTALHECAALGLLPTLNQVKLIKYGDQLKCMPQWQGYKALMERHPAILEVQAFLVHKSDQFAVTNGEVSHAYDPFDPARTIEKPSDIRGGYCKILYRDGRAPRYHFVPVAHIEKARQCAQTQNVWTKWYEQMAMKTLYRDCYARRAVPIDPLIHARLQRVTEADDVQLGNDPARVVVSRTESLAQRLAADAPKAPQHQEPEDQSHEIPQSESEHVQEEPAEQQPLQERSPDSEAPPTELYEDLKRAIDGLTDVARSVPLIGRIDQGGETGELTVMGVKALKDRLESKLKTLRGNSRKR